MFEYAVTECFYYVKTGCFYYVKNVNQNNRKRVSFTKQIEILNF